FPFALETAGNETVVGIDGAITALGALRLIGGTLYTKAPLLECRVVIRLEPFGGSECGRKPCWLEGGDEGLCDSIVDLFATDVEAKDPTTLDENLAGAVIGWSRRASAIMSMQSSAAVAATGQALQKSSAFSHGAADLMRSWPGVFGDTCQIVLIGLPIDESGMMIFDEHLPLGAR